MSPLYLIKHLEVRFERVNIQAKQIYWNMHAELNRIRTKDTQTALRIGANHTNLFTIFFAIHKTLLFFAIHKTCWSSFCRSLHRWLLLSISFQGQYAHQSSLFSVTYYHQIRWWEEVLEDQSSTIIVCLSWDLFSVLR